jgi:signal transduction histidine kinase
MERRKSIAKISLNYRERFMAKQKSSHRIDEFRSVKEREVVEGKEMVIERGDGARLLVSVHASPILKAEGKAIAVRTMLDINERRKAEEELGKYRGELELLVEERTAMLSKAYDDLQAEVEERKRTEEQLRQVHTMKAIRTLSGGIAHEFNNMLAVIMGNAELALDDPVEEGCRGYLNQILKASERSRDLVRQILTFSRSNTGRERTVKMAPLLRETYKLLRASLPRTIRMDLKLRTKSDTIFADPSLVRQVVVNLANNAAYAMREAGGILTIGLSSITLGSDSLQDRNVRPGCYVKLTVKDTGSGIAHDVQKRIFEPFFTTKGQGEGTGMGLSVVYGIVQSYHGMIEVESAAGLGSTFTVLLPESDVLAATDEQEEASPCP